jgi:hypothetical protein
MNTGTLAAVCSRLTNKGDVVIDVMSHAAPTSWAYQPMFDVTDASQRARNTGTLSGSQAEPLDVDCRDGGLMSSLVGVLATEGG